MHLLHRADPGILQTGIQIGPMGQSPQGVIHTLKHNIKLVHILIGMYWISGTGWPNIRPFLESGFGSGSRRVYRKSQSDSDWSFWQLVHS